MHGKTEKKNRMKEFKFILENGYLISYWPKIDTCLQQNPVIVNQHIITFSCRII